MKTNEDVLQIISNETKQYVAEVGVVTPSIYSNAFSKFASSHNANVENEKEITDNLLNKKIDLFTDIQKSTAENARKLSENTDKALCAIQDKDETVLAEVLQETQSLRIEIEKLKESVYKDELTNTFNRKWLHDNYLDDTAQKFTSDGTIAIIDLNYFKIINDTFGHVIGDKILIFIANQLRTSSEHVIRYGGDEFIVIYPNSISQETSFAKLNKLRENILKKSIKVKDTSFKMSFSLGVQSFKEGDTLVDVIDKADKNMYNDKIKIKKKVTGI